MRRKECGGLVHANPKITTVANSALCKKRKDYNRDFSLRGNEPSYQKKSIGPVFIRE